MKPKTLGHDRTGSERIMGPLILMASFILITVMVIASMAAFLQAASGSWDEVKGTQIIGTTEYTLRNPVLGWNLTDDNVIDRWDHNADENVAFYEDDPGEDDELVVALIRDNAWYRDDWVSFSNIDEIRYLNYVMIYTEFGIWSNDEWPISFETILSNRVTDGNVSVTEFGIRHNTTFALIITVDAPQEFFETGLWNNNFNVKIGIPDFQVDIGEASMWTVLGQVMTASLPDVGREVNILIGSTIYAGIGLIAFTIITRALPDWLSGG